MASVVTASNDKVVVTVDHELIRLEWSRGVTIDEQAARDAASFVNRLSSDKRRPMIVGMATTAAVSRQARTVFLEPSAANAIALLGKSPVDRVIANFILGVSNLPCPTRFFTAEAAALDWIRSLAG
jgi:hypothetical protein